ncbi:PAS domain S-box protein [Salinarimonas soli]|uniref:histidine kinase n=1 Tax=Salinarimonas soli TaxID=1638099 RepID=A0A5B2VB93_9HYPH|nr:PAS domain S-box protein [Salinarimonas soli]KAA2235925.1 PAS domain S-box protein [Salinarimonas soli]
MRAHDWTASPLGRPETWPQSLRSVVGLILGSKFPMFVAWGPELGFLYNDAYAEILGAKHPAALGARFQDIWAEIWPDISPLITAAMAGEGTFRENLPLLMNRKGFDEPTWFTFSYSPVRDEDGQVAGMYCACTETTATVIAESRLRESEARLAFLDRLGAETVALADADAVLAVTTRLLGEHLDLSVCAYADMDEDEDGFTIRGDWAAPGAKSILGRYSLAAFGKLAVTNLTAGLPLVINDNRRELAPEEAATFQAIGIAATICMPLVKDGRLTALMAIHDRVPRVWTDAELNLLREVTARSWAHVERVGAVAELRESEARFRNMADHAPVMMWVTDASGSCTYLNRGWYEFTGQSVGEGLGLGWTHATHPDDRTLAEEAFLAANAAQAPFQVEYRLRRADGSYRWALDTAAPRFGTNGEFLGFIGSVIDIDERREAEARLAYSEEQLRLAIETAEIGLWDVDLRTDTLFWPPRIKAAFGISPDVPVSMNDFYAGLHPDDQEHTTAAFAAACDPEQRALYDVEYRTIGKEDGIVRWVAAKGRGLFDDAGTCVRVIGTAIDITARKAEERQLRELNETLEQRVSERTADRDRMWRLSTDLMLVARFDAMITAVNPAWTTLLGWSESELIGRRFTDMVHPDDIAATLAEAGSLAKGQTTLPFENRYQHKDGSYRHLSWTAVPGEDLIHAVARDVTAEKQRQHELAQTQDALRQAQKMEAVGQLTGGVAHDFNNLLTIIKSSTDLLRRPDLPGERRRRYVDAISDTVDRASKLTGQLLAFARRQSLKPEVFDAAERIRSVSDMLRTIVGSRIAIRTEVEDEHCFVDADAAQFDTALVNMAVNARDAMDGEGSLTIRIDTADLSTIGGKGDASGAVVAVSLTDTGTGIDPEQMPHIFEPFFTTKEVGKGTGLGLSQVYGFAKQSGGDIAVESEVGRGTTFTLYLPRVDPVGSEVLDGAGASTARREHGRGTRVLVVEDNRNVGEFSTQLLQDLGYETTWAGNAADALAYLNGQQAFDVVFSDVVMPGMNGVELGHEIRRLYPGLPILLTSGYSHVLAEEGRHGFELLQKPYAAEELSRVLRRVLRQQGASRAT